ncbi:unnamed protein product [Spirodela intermedia]|uniref:Transmembrane 9 superfamily member n=1 Tax=Spirodela intermedia TaxID=51605 RepID=A0A7I8IP41_SPIIN|nr:unnamed protein product [Spirodela intermedia]CAA6659726.1 unnamed protein product [Spirodela intermedia]
MSYRHGEEIYALAGPCLVFSIIFPWITTPSRPAKPLRGDGLPPTELGEIIASGTIRSSSPYRFRVNVNESLYLCTTAPLTRRDVHLLVDRKLKGYIVNMFLDDLPLLSFDQDFSFKTIKGFLFSDMSIDPERTGDSDDANGTVRRRRKTQVNGRIPGWKLIAREIFSRRVARSSSAPRSSSYAEVGTLSSFLCLLALWGGVLSPVTFLGGFLAARRRSYPGEAAATAGIRQGLLWVMIVAFSCLIFADIEREFRLVIDSLCYGRYYKITALTTATVLLWAIACSTYSIIAAYFHIYAGDSRWWWKSLLVSGFSGAHAFFIAVRAVGFLSTLYFVRFLYASVKL